MQINMHVQTHIGSCIIILLNKIPDLGHSLTFYELQDFISKTFKE